MINGVNVKVRACIARTEKDRYSLYGDKFRTTAIAKLSKRELEDRYYEILHDNMELKKTLNQQTEMSKMLTTKLQRASSAIRGERERDGENLARCKTALKEQKDVITDLRMANVRLSDKVKRLNMQLCSAKMFLKKSTQRKPYRPFAKNLSNNTLNSLRKDVLSLSSKTVMEQSTDSNNKSLDGIIVLPSLPPETSSSETIIKTSAKLCEDNKCKEMMEDLKKQVSKLNEELDKAQNSYADHIKELEQKLKTLKQEKKRMSFECVELAQQCNVKTHAALAAEQKLRAAQTKCDELSMLLSLEKGKVEELLMQIKSVNLSAHVAKTIEQYLSKQTKEVPTKDKIIRTTKEPKTNDDSGYIEQTKSPDSEMREKMPRTKKDELLKKISNLQLEMETYMMKSKDSLRSEVTKNLTLQIQDRCEKKMSSADENRLNSPNNEKFLYQINKNLLQNNEIVKNKPNFGKEIQIPKEKSYVKKSARKICARIDSHNNSIKGKRRPKHASNASSPRQTVSPEHLTESFNQGNVEKDMQTVAGNYFTDSTWDFVYTQNVTVKNIDEGLNLDDAQGNNAITGVDMKLDLRKIRTTSYPENVSSVSSSENARSLDAEKDSNVIKTKSLSKIEFNSQNVDYTQKNIANLLIPVNLPKDDAEVDLPEDNVNESIRNNTQYHLEERNTNAKPNQKGLEQRKPSADGITYKTQTVRLHRVKRKIKPALAIKKVDENKVDENNIENRKTLHIQDFSPENTDAEISTLSDLPNEHEPMLEHLRVLSPGEQRQYSEVTTTDSKLSATDFGSLSEGELPFMSRTMKMFNGHQLELNTCSEEPTTPNVESALEAIKDELTKCRSLLYDHQREMQGSAASTWTSVT